MRGRGLDGWDVTAWVPVGGVHECICILCECVIHAPHMDLNVYAYMLCCIYMCYVVSHSNKCVVK